MAREWESDSTRGGIRRQSSRNENPARSSFFHSRPAAACMVIGAGNQEDGRRRDGRDGKAASDLLVQTVGDIVPIPSPNERLLGI
jgi:hypothetical protein